MKLEDHLADAIDADVLAQVLALAGADAPEVQRQVGAVDEMTVVVGLAQDVLDEHRQVVGRHVLVATHLFDVISHLVEAAARGKDAVSHLAVVHDSGEAHM